MQLKEIVAGKVARLAAIMVALACMLVMQPVCAMGDEGSASASSAADVPGASDSLARPAMGGLPMMGDDYAWVGNNLNLDGAAVRNDLLAAGQNIDVKACEVGGDVRAAARNVELSDLVVAKNVTAAGETVILRNVKADAVAAAGNKASFTGSCSSLVVYANKVFIDGTVEGDVVVGAESVEVGADAKITGTLHVEAPEEPVVQGGAQVGKMEFTQTEQGASTAEIGAALASSISVLVIALAIAGIVGMLLMALLAEWLFRRHTAAAAQMIRTRTGATIGSGVVGAIAAPLAIVFLCALVITLPVAGALTLALLAMSVVAGGFAGASLFKLAFPRLNRFGCALAGGAIVGVASAVPFLGALVQAAAFMYFLGYVLQSIFLGMRKDAPAGNAPAVPAPVAPATVASAPVAPAPGVPVTGAPAPVASMPGAPTSGAPVSGTPEPGVPADGSTPGASV